MKFMLHTLVCYKLQDKVRSLQTLGAMKQRQAETLLDEIWKIP